MALGSSSRKGRWGFSDAVRLVKDEYYPFMAFQDLLAFRKSFALAMKIFRLAKNFPKEEVYSLTNQIRR